MLFPMGRTTLATLWRRPTDDAPTAGVDPRADGAYLHVFNSLGEPSQGSVGVIFKSGSVVLCANFGGTVTKDSGTNPPNPGGKGQFAAKDASAPGACPTPPVTCP
jgi:hypothetical protein